MKTTDQVVAYVQTGLLAGVFFLLVSDMARMSDEPSSPAPPDLGEETLVGLHQFSVAMDSLRSTLDTLPGKLRLAMPKGLERQPIMEDAGLSKLTAQIARLEQTLRKRQGNSPSGSVRHGDRPPVWGNVARLVEAKKSAGRTSIRRSYFLYSESDLVARFGVPSEIVLSPTGTERWKYTNRDRNLDLGFDLHWGRVIDVW